MPPTVTSDANYGWRRPLAGIARQAASRNEVVKNWWRRTRHGTEIVVTAAVWELILSKLTFF
jgi:hypothetical protein